MNKVSISYQYYNIYFNNLNTMDKKIIEKYIYFAIDNMFDLEREFIIQNNSLNKLENGIKQVKHYAEYQLMFEYDKTVLFRNLCELITGKKFIKAICFGIKDCNNTGWNGLKFKTLEDFITYKQAIAIRDNKLEEFINEILDLEEEISESYGCCSFDESVERG